MAWERYQALDREGEKDFLRQAAAADPTQTVVALRYISFLRTRFELAGLERLRAELAAEGSATAVCLAAVAAQPRGAVLYVDTIWAAFERGDSACAPLFLAQQATGLRPRSRWEPLRIELARMATSREPEVWTGWAEYAEALAQAGKPDSARIVLAAGLAVVRLPVDRVRLNVRRAGLRASTGDTAGAVALRQALDAAVRREGSPGLEYAYLREIYRAYSWDELEKDRLLDSAASLARAHGAWDLEHSALNELARRLLDRGETEESLRIYERLTAIADSVGAAPLQAVSHRSRGRAHARLGDRTAALLELQLAEEAARRSREPYLLADALHNQAHVYESAGEYGRAARAAELGAAAASVLEHSPLGLILLRDLGLIRWKAGWHGAARAAFDEMVDRIVREQRNAYWAGEYLEREGRLSEGLDLFRKGIEWDPNEIALNLAGKVRVFEALGMADSAGFAAREHDRHLTANFDPPLLPRVMAGSGQVDAGVSLAREWADRQRRQGNLQGAAAGYVEAAQLLLGARRWSMAQQVAEEARILADSMSFVDESVAARQVRGIALARAGDPESGSKQLREAADLARRHPTMGSIVATYTALGEALSASGDLSGALEAYNVAAQSIETGAVSVFGDLHRASFRTQQLTPFTGALRALLASGQARSRLPAVFSWAARRKAAALAEATGVTLRERRPSLSEVRASLSGTETLIDYLVIDSLVAAFVVTPEDAALVELDIDPAGVRSLVQRLRGPLDASFAGAVDLARISFDAPAARTLYRLVLEPALEMTDRARTLLIAPDGPLHHIPFDALVTGEGELSVIRLGDVAELDQVIDQFEVVYVPSGWFVVNRSHGFDWRPSPNPRIVAVSHEAPGADAEVASLRTAWPSARLTLFRGETATETAVRRALAGHDVAHFAVHASADDRDVLGSYLRLAPDSLNDGYMHVGEFGGLQLATSLVVLSGCETVIGPLYEGEGLMGLARGYLAAGTPMVVATQWPIGAAAASLTGAFYGNLAAGEPSVSALRSAKLAVRSDPETRHPFYWAGWLVIGG